MTVKKSNKEYELTIKQAQVFQTTANECFAGGSASGGKTFCNKMLAITVAEQVPGAQIAILRNTSKNLKKNYFQGAESIPSILAEHIKAKLVNVNYSDMTVTWLTGSCIHFMHAEHVETAIENLTGIEFVLIIFDEAVLINKQIMNFSKTRLRVGSLVIQNDFWRARLPRLQLTSNPGGISHNYLKTKYINPAPPGTEFIDEYGKKILFIPFGARENPHIDYEAYEREIKSTGDDLLFKRLAEGDWDSGGSTFFGDAFLRTKNVIPDFELPADWRVYRCFDPGFSAPFAYALLAYVKGQNTVTMKDGSTRYFPNGSVIVYREWYGWDGKDYNVGKRMVHEEVAEGIRAREIGWGLRKRILAGKADNQLWNAETNAAAIYEKYGVHFHRADKSKGTRAYGALKMRRMLLAAHDVPLEKPALFFVDVCTCCIATIPELPTDPDDPDDVVTENVPDHAYDAIRYQIATDAKTAGTIGVTGL